MTVAPLPAADGAGHFAELVPGIERVLARSLDGDVRVGAVERVSDPERRNQLLRCRLDAAPAGAPETVMVKRRRPSDYRPDDPAAWATLGLFRDWAGLQFLTEVGDEVGTVLAGSPRYYGGDRSAGFVVMEDLGAPSSLADLLLYGEAEAAERGLVRLAATLGRMHAATIGREDHYRRLRDALGPGDGPELRAKEAENMRTAGRRIFSLVADLGVGLPGGVQAEVERVAAVTADPGPFLAYTHGDPCPDNNAIVASGAGEALRLIDFELGGYYHALRDGVYGRIRFPTCWCVRDLPEPLVERMDAAYRSALVPSCPAAADDATYARAVVESCAGWLLTSLGWSLERTLDYDPVWGVATHRQRALLRLGAFAGLAHRAGHLEALADTADGLRRALESRWQSSTLPISLYPAFTRGAEPPRERVEALARAIDAGDEAAARALLRDAPGAAALANAPAPDSAALPMLTRAVQRNHEALVALLLEHGADWRLTPRSGEAALVVAAEVASVAVVRRLLDHGADPNARDATGVLPVHAAVRAGRSEVVQLLLDRGATLDLLGAIALDRFEEAGRLAERPRATAFRFRDGRTLLHAAAELGDTAARYVPLLVEHGAPLGATTWSGLTALHAAAAAGHAAVVRALLAAGADPAATTDEGDTPLALAERGGHARVADLLRGQGAG